jgi:hypothetical protein
MQAIHTVIGLALAIGVAVECWRAGEHLVVRREAARDAAHAHEQRVRARVVTWVGHARHSRTF